MENQENDPALEDNKLFNELAESIADIFFILDHQFRVLYWNDQAEDITGIPREKIHHQSFYDFFPAIEDEPVDKAFQNALEHQQPQTYEQTFTINKKDYVFEISAHPSSVGLFVYSKNLTEQKEALEKEKKQKEFFQTVIENIPVFLMHISPKNEITWVNIPFQIKLGYSSYEIREYEVLNKLFSKQPGSNFKEEFLSIPENTWKNFTALTREGNHIITSWTMVRLSDGSKIGIGQDVTEMNKQFEELTQLNQHINAIINNIPVILFSTDLDGKYRSLMGMGLDKIGIDPRKMLNQSAYHIYGDYSFQTGNNQVTNVKKVLDYVKKDKRVSGNMTINGRSLTLEMVPEKTSQKSLRGILGVALDITGQRKAEEELKNTNQMLQKTLDSIKEVVLVVGTKGRRGIVLCNQAVKDVFGYEPEELMGKTTRLLYPTEESFKEFGRIGEKELDEHGTFHGEYQMVRRDGKIITTEHTINPLDEKKGWRYGVVSVIRDISERKDYLQKIENYSKRLKNLNSHLQKVQEEERARIAREIHDEVGQIFSILNFNLTSLSKELTESSGQIDRKYIQDELEAMKNITDQAIQTTRRFISELRPMAVDHMSLDQALSWLCEDFQTRTGIDTNFENHAGNVLVEEEIKINLFRILQEALTNVRRHANATSVRVALNIEANKLQMNIADNGKGIQEAHKHKMSSFGILGIQERINDMNGEMEIKGKDNEGTQISLIVPLKTK